MNNTNARYVRKVTVSFFCILVPSLFRKLSYGYVITVACYIGQVDIK